MSATAGASAGPDLLDALARRAGADALSSATLRDEAIALAGTAASTVTRALSLFIGQVARTPSLRGAIARDVDAALQRRSPRATDLARLPVAWIAQRWDWELAPGAELQLALRPEGLVPVRGLRITLRPR